VEWERWSFLVLSPRLNSFREIRFYEEVTIVNAVNAIKDPFAMFETMPCFQCSTCKCINQCRYSEISGLHRRWKDAYKACIPSQSDLVYILDGNDIS